MDYSLWFVCLMGMGTVFFGLVCIIILTKLMSAVLGKKPEPAQSASGSADALPQTVTPELVAAVSAALAQQGYIPADGATVRVRTRDDKAYLTIKGKSVNGGMTRYEFEKEITMDEAQHLLQLCKGGVIDKRRYLVKSGKHTFEVDEFYGDNEGLVMAEVELSDENEAYVKPDFIGMEVTGDKRFYNSHLLNFPFVVWRNTLPEEYR